MCVRVCVFVSHWSAIAAATIAIIAITNHLAIDVAVVIDVVRYAL